MWGLDMHRDFEPAWDLHGQYTTDVYTEESVKIIKEHNKTRPLFLYLAHLAPHTGNFYNFLAAGDQMVQKYEYIGNYSRRRYAGK